MLPLARLTAYACFLLVIAVVRAARADVRCRREAQALLRCPQLEWSPDKLQQWVAGSVVHTSPWRQRFEGWNDTCLIQVDEHNFSKVDFSDYQDMHNMLLWLAELKQDCTKQPAIGLRLARPLSVGRLLTCTFPLVLGAFGVFWLLYAATDHTSDGRILMLVVGVQAVVLAAIFISWCIYLDVGEGSVLHTAYDWAMNVQLFLYPLSWLVFAHTPQYEREGFMSILIIGAALMLLLLHQSD